MTAATTITVRATRRFRASGERVFDAWLDVERARRFMFTASSEPAVRAEIDARVGGRFVLVDRREGEDVEHVGEYVEIDRPRRLVFLFGVPSASSDMDRVTIEIVPAGSGCELTLTHEMAARWSEYRDRTEDGWRSMLEALEGALEAAPDGAPRDGPPSSSGYGVATAPDTVRFERLLRGPIDRVWAYLTDPEKRAQWLAAGPMELRVGGRVSLVFRHGELSPTPEVVPERYRSFDGAVVEGRVTRCEPPHVLGYTWGEAEGVDSEVTFELADQGDRVHLVLTHRRLAGRAAMLSVAGGWHTHLDILADRLAGRAPAPFWATHERWEADYATRLRGE